MARDRKRAKQRRNGAGPRLPRASGLTMRRRRPRPATPGQLVRADLPGSLDHAAAEVDEFDAALVRGAGGVPALPRGGRSRSSPWTRVTRQTSCRSCRDQAARPGRRPAGARQAAVAADGMSGSARAPSGAPLRGGNRAIGFLRASWAELQRGAVARPPTGHAGDSRRPGLRRDRRRLPRPSHDYRRQGNRRIRSSWRT